MDISYLGHAGFQIDHAGHTLVLDPWLSREGAFLRSWFQYPENHLLADRVASLDPARSAIYVSHAHPDHFDRSFLGRIDRATPLVTGRYVRRHLARELRAMGFTEVHELNTGESLELRGFRLTLYVNESYSNEDSGILVEAGGCRFLDLNDCRAHDAIDLDALRPVDLFTVQFSGASWFPCVYDYEPDRRAELTARKNEQKFRNVQALIERLAPKLFVPSAGPGCFLDAELFRHNFGAPSAFPEFREFRPWVEATGVPSPELAPGDHIRLRAGEMPRVEASGPRPPASEADRRAYLRGYAERFAGESALPETDRDAFPLFRAALEAKIAALRQPLVTRHRIGVRVTGRPGLPDGCLLVNLQRRCLEDVEELPAAGTYSFRYENRVLDHFFRCGAPWEELMLSLRFQVSREPDVFDTRISDFMRLEAQDLRHYPRRARSGRVCIEHEGVRYEVDRYCPHQGGDLSRALIVDGALICPRHGWAFDLSRGGRSEESLTTIHAVRLADADSPGDPAPALDPDREAASLPCPRRRAG